MWTRFTRLHAVVVTLVIYAGAWLAVVAFGDGAAWVGVGLLALFIVYCCARPRRGGDVFFAFLLPGGTSALASEALGVDRLWFAIPLTHPADPGLASRDVGDRAPPRRQLGRLGREAQGRPAR